MSFNFVIPEMQINGAGTPPLQFFRRGFNLGASGSQPSWRDVVIHGNTALTLVNAKANGINYLKLFGKCEQRNLPEGYTQLEYIESTGTQYIDSGIYGDETTEITTTFQRTAVTDSAIYGVFSGSTGNDNLVSYTSNISTNWRFDSTTTSVPYFGASKVTTVQNATGVWVDDTLYPIANTPTSFTTSKTIPIFCRWATADSIYNSFVQAQMYIFSIKKNNVLVFNGIPAKRNSDNVVGMYDTVTNTFLTNQGTGTFTAGPTAVPAPDEPLSIISNNGALKYSANMANVNEQTALIGYYISGSGVVTADNNNWIYQDYIPVKPNTTYTLTMSSSVYYVTITEYSTADDSGFIIRKAGISGDNTTLTITTESTTNYVRFGTNIDRSAVTLDRVLAINWMLNQGNSLPYAPYSPNSIYTDGTTETVAILKNYAETFTLSDEVPNQSGSQMRAGTILTNLPAGTYRLNKGGYSSSMYIYGKVGDVKTEYVIITTDTEVTLSGTGDLYIYASSGISVSALSNLTLEVYNTTEQTATAEMLLAIGSYQDVQSVLDGEVTRSVGVKVLDGSENWQRDTNDISITKTTLFGYAISADSAFLMTHFGNTYSNTGFRIGAQSFYTKNTLWPTVTAFKQFLSDQYNSGNPVVIVYPLAEPATETVTAQPLTIQEGTNTIEITQASIDNLELEVSYKGTL